METRFHLTGGWTNHAVIALLASFGLITGACGKPSLSKGEVYESIAGNMTIRVVSENEVDIMAYDLGDAFLVAQYSVDGDSPTGCTIAA